MACTTVPESQVANDLQPCRDVTNGRANRVAPRGTSDLSKLLAAAAAPTTLQRGERSDRSKRQMDFGRDASTRICRAGGCIHCRVQAEQGGREGSWRGRSGPAEARDLGPVDRQMQPMIECRYSCASD